MGKKASKRKSPALYGVSSGPLIMNCMQSIRPSWGRHHTYHNRARAVPLTNDNRAVNQMILERGCVSGVSGARANQK